MEHFKNILDKVLPTVVSVLGIDLFSQKRGSRFNVKKCFTTENRGHWDRHQTSGAAGEREKGVLKAHIMIGVPCNNFIAAGWREALDLLRDPLLAIL